jgi:hypothetical protein
MLPFGSGTSARFAWKASAKVVVQLHENFCVDGSGYPKDKAGPMSSLIAMAMVAIERDREFIVHR